MESYPFLQTILGLKPIRQSTNPCLSTGERRMVLRLPYLISKRSSDAAGEASHELLARISRISATGMVYESKIKLLTKSVSSLTSYLILKIAKKTNTMTATRTILMI